jgi:hypothetical protein
MKWAVVSAAVVALAMPAGQIAQLGSLTGIVVDAASRAPVKGAIVQVVADDVRRTATADDGRFSFTALPVSKDLYLTAKKARAEGEYGRRWIGGGRFELPAAIRATI